VSDYDGNDLNALDRLEDLLDAYREVRLAPSGAALARIRANVLVEAGAVQATAAASSRLRLVEPAPKRLRWSFPPRFVRTGLALGFAATLTLGTSFAVLAAPPGSPFYNARVYLETAFLPAQSEARFEGHEKLLEERLHEAQLAAAGGDTAALAAALDAYQAEVDAATTAAGNDLDMLAHLEEMLAKHTATLTALAAGLPQESSIEHAIQASSNAITKLQQNARPAHASHAPEGGSPAGSDGSGGNGSGEDGQGGGQGAQDNSQR
jgi:hypothetical protein